MNSENRRPLIETARKWMSFWQGHDLSEFNSLHSEDFADRSSSGRGADRESFKKGLVELYRAFPDFFAESDGFVVDSETNEVAIRWTAIGTHSHSFMGAEPTFEKITFHGIEIIRIVDGLVVERWGEWDGGDILEQLKSG